MSRLKYQRVLCVGSCTQLYSAYSMVFTELLLGRKLLGLIGACFYCIFVFGHGSYTFQQ